MKKFIICLFAVTMGLCGLSSCSEDTATEEEYANWQERNDLFFASLADSLRAAPNQWKHIKCYSLNPATEGSATDYVYAKEIERGEGTESPLYTDSVRVIYQGRLIPSASYSRGYVFDGTVYGTYSSATSATAKMRVGGLVDGLATAVQHMHCGDHWRVYIPYDLGYKTEDNSTIPAYSTLIFDITLVDFSHIGEVMPVWSARRVER